MALPIISMNDFQVYLDGVIKRANCHAPNVANIILPLAGLILWKSTDITVREYNGKPANMIWIHISGRKFCFLYDHSTGTIRLLERASTGKLLAIIDNNSNLNSITALLP